MAQQNYWQSGTTGTAVQTEQQRAQVLLRSSREQAAQAKTDLENLRIVTELVCRSTEAEERPEVFSGTSKVYTDPEVGSCEGQRDNLGHQHCRETGLSLSHER